MKKAETSIPKRAQNGKKVNFREYLDGGTGKIFEIISSPDVDVVEKQAIIDAYANELTNNIGNADNLTDYEPLLYSVSVQYIDDKISNELSKDPPVVEGCLNGINLCQRQRKLLNRFHNQQWKCPEIKNNDLDRCENEFRTKKEGLSIANKIQEENNQLNKLIAKAQEKLSTKLCDDALELLVQMEVDKSDYESKGFVLTGVYKKDNGNIRKTIENIRWESEQKDKLYQELIDADSDIFCCIDTIPEREEREEQWIEIIALAQEQLKRISECNRNGWSVPSIKYTNPNNLVEQYRHYIEMIKYDRAIESQKDAFAGTSSGASDEQFESFSFICHKQGVNIDLCNENSWALPELVVSDPLAVREAIRIKREKSKQVKKLRLFGIVAVISIISAIVGFFAYKQGKIQTPFDSSSVVGEKMDVICDELEKAGFKNISTKEDKDGWLSDSMVTRISVDGNDSFSRGKYFKPDVDVVVYFSSKGRKDVSGILGQWANTDYNTLGEQLRSAGYENVYFMEEDTFEQEKNQRTASVTVNGIDYSSGPCHIPTSAEILITYYTLKIRMENAASKFEGKYYEDVISSLQARGFTNIEPQRADNLKIGLLKKEGDISSISINGDYSFDKGDIFNYYDQIIIVVNTYPGSGCDDITVTAY